MQSQCIVFHWHCVAFPIVLKCRCLRRAHLEAGFRNRLGIFIVVLHRALPDLQRMKLLLFCCRVVGTEVGILFGAIKPDL